MIHQWFGSVYIIRWSATETSDNILIYCGQYYIRINTFDCGTNWQHVLSLTQSLLDSKLC